jgi:excisionase family DNA binding protein
MVQAIDTQNRGPDFALDTEMLKPEAVAHQLQISRTKAYALIKSGEIESVRIGGNRRVPREALNSYISGLRAAAS